MISAFCFSYNVIEQQIPFLESLRSWSAVVDEIIVVDGGSTDGSVDEIRKISNKIKIVDDVWPENWTYYDFGRVFNRGFEETTGDVALKIDLDYVVPSTSDTMFHAECESMVAKGDILMIFGRFNFILSDRYFVKSCKTLGVNKKIIRETGADIKWGFDPEIKGLCEDAIIRTSGRDGIYFGKTLSQPTNRSATNLPIFNYSYLFTDLETAKKKWYRNRLGWRRTFGVIGEYSIDDSWKEYVEMILGYMRQQQFKIHSDRHPIDVQDKIRNLMPGQHGYNFFNLCETSSYYAKI